MEEITKEQFFTGLAFAAILSSLGKDEIKGILSNREINDWIVPASIFWGERISGAFAPKHLACSGA